MCGVAEIITLFFMFFSFLHFLYFFHNRIQDFVFCRITEEMDLVLSGGNGDSVSLLPDEIHILQYSEIRPYVLEGRILLI